MSQGKTVRIKGDVFELLREYMKEKKLELIEQGLISDADVIQSLILKALMPWLEAHPDLLKRYLTE